MTYSVPLNFVSEYRSTCRSQVVSTCTLEVFMTPYHMSVTASRSRSSCRTRPPARSSVDPLVECRLELFDFGRIRQCEGGFLLQALIGASSQFPTVSALARMCQSKRGFANLKNLQENRRSPSCCSNLIEEIPLLGGQYDVVSDSTVRDTYGATATHTA